jgi:parallel beta-helix repeat protein
MDIIVVSEPDCTIPVTLPADTLILSSFREAVRTVSANGTLHLAPGEHVCNFKGFLLSSKSITIIGYDQTGQPWRSHAVFNESNVMRQRFCLEMGRHIRYRPSSGNVPHARIVLENCFDSCDTWNFRGIALDVTSNGVSFMHCCTQFVDCDIPSDFDFNSVAASFIRCTISSAHINIGCNSNVTFDHCLFLQQCCLLGDTHASFHIRLINCHVLGALFFTVYGKCELEQVETWDGGSVSVDVRENGTAQMVDCSLSKLSITAKDRTTCLMTRCNVWPIVEVKCSDNSTLQLNCCAITGTPSSILCADEASCVRISDSTFITCDVKILDSATCTMERCEFLCSPAHGITLSSCLECVLEKCRFANSSFTGVFVDNEAAKLCMRHCVSECNAESGVTIANSHRCELEHVDIVGNRAGVIIQDGAGVLSRVTVRGSRTDGIVMMTKSPVALKDCIVEESGRFGIRCPSHSALLKGCRVAGSGVLNVFNFEHKSAPSSPSVIVPAQRDGSKRMLKVLTPPKNFDMVVDTRKPEALRSRQAGVFTTITAALAAAGPGSTIGIHAGRYNEHVLVDKDVTIVGLGDVSLESFGGNCPTLVVRNCSAAIRCLRVLRGIANNVAVQLLEWHGIMEDCSVHSVARKSPEDASGLLVVGGTGTVRHCIVSACDQDGVVVIGNSCITFCECVFTGNARRGVRISEAARVRLEASVCTKNGESGICITDTGTCQLQKCQISENQHCGIRVMDSAELHLADSSVALNDWSGVSFENASSGSIVRSLLERNAESGVRIADASEVRLAECNLSENGRGGVHQMMHSKTYSLEACTMTRNFLGNVLMNGTCTTTAASEPAS